MTICHKRWGYKKRIHSYLLIKIESRRRLSRDKGLLQPKKLILNRIQESICLIRKNQYKRSSLWPLFITNWDLG